MISLLDVNVLIALLDAEHLHHDTANDWFADHAGDGWASCPLTQNGVIRIMSNTRYAGAAGTTGEVADVVAKLCARSDHAFWPDDVSILDSARVDRA